MPVVTDAAGKTKHFAYTAAGKAAARKYARKTKRKKARRA